MQRMSPHSSASPLSGLGEMAGLATDFPSACVMGGRLVGLALAVVPLGVVIPAEVEYLP